MSYSERRIPSAHAGLHYAVRRGPGFATFTVMHESSGLPVASIHNARRPATDFVRWADAALAGPDWKAGVAEITREGSGGLAAFGRFLRGVEDENPHGRQIQRVREAAMRECDAERKRRREAGQKP